MDQCSFGQVQAAVIKDNQGQVQEDAVYLKTQNNKSCFFHCAFFILELTVPITSPQCCGEV
jgi:hypothetical protein